MWSRRTAERKYFVKYRVSSPSCFVSPFPILIALFTSPLSSPTLVLFSVIQTIQTTPSSADIDLSSTETVDIVTIYHLFDCNLTSAWKAWLTFGTAQAHTKKI